MIGLREYLALGALLAAGAYHLVAVQRAREEGETEAREACALAVANARARALGEYIAQQGTVDRLAQIEAGQLAAQLSSIDERVRGLTVTYQEHARAKPLPVDCRLDAGRVVRINAARGQRREATTR